MTNPDVEAAWDEFWLPLLLESSGGTDATKFLDAVKAELYDYAWLLGAASVVYTQVTDGMISKPDTNPDVVLAAALDAEDKRWREWLDDEITAFLEKHGLEDPR